MLVTYTISMYVKTEKIATTPQTLSFCCSCWGVKCEKKMHIPGSLSLSLSLSSVGEESERRGQRELALVGSNHPSCHLQLPGLPYAHIQRHYTMLCTLLGTTHRACWTLIFFFLYITYYIIKSLCFVQMRVTLKNDFEWYFFFIRLPPPVLGVPGAQVCNAVFLQVRGW